MPPTLDQLRERYGKEPEPDDPRKDLTRTDVGLYTHGKDPFRLMSWCGLDAKWMEARGARWAPASLDPTCPACLAAMGKAKVDPLGAIHRRLPATNGRLACGFVGPKGHREGWNGGGWTFEPAKVTCPACLAATTSQDPLTVIHIMSKEMPRMECGYIKPADEDWGKGGGWSKGYARGGSLKITCAACRLSAERSGMCVDCGHPIGHPSGCTCVADAMERDASDAIDVAKILADDDDIDARPMKPTPVGRCAWCGAESFISGGFCGVCHPGRL